MVTIPSKRKDIAAVLKDPDAGWDDSDGYLAGDIKESKLSEADMLKAKCEEMLDNPAMKEAEKFLKGCMEQKVIDAKSAAKIEKLYELIKK